MKETSEPTSARGRGRPKLLSDESQKALIVDGARQLFLERGYGRTTTDDVAAQCRISKQKLYRLFPGKPALFAAVVDAHRHSMLALPGDYNAMPLDEALLKIFHFDIDAAVERERIALLQMVVHEARQFPELEAILRQYGAERSRDELAKWLIAQHRRGRIRIDNGRRTAQILMDMIFGAVVPKIGDSVVLQQAAQRRKHVRQCIAIFLNGVAAR
jgi:AcrR family transcriptional regulator